MDRKLGGLALVALVLAGCTYGGHYVRSGPCEGWRTDSEACGRAAVNMAAIAKVQVGQTMEQVRTVKPTPTSN